MKNIFIILISLTFLGCSAQKRMDRLIRKHPELLTMDTTVIIDTVISPQIIRDTTFKTTPGKIDTFTFNVPCAEVTITASADKDSLGVTLDQHADSTEQKTIILTETIYEECSHNWWMLGAGGAFILLLILIARKLLN